MKLTHEISLICIFQALCGSRVEIPSLNGGDSSILNLTDEIVRPSTVKRVSGRGLPHPKDPSKRGDILVNFEIAFPERLPQGTRESLRNLLPNK